MVPTPNPSYLLFLCSLVSKTTGAAVLSQPRPHLPSFFLLLLGPYLGLLLGLPLILPQSLHLSWALASLTYVGGSPHPSAGITSPQLFGLETLIPSLTHTTREPVREAWGSAFRIQTHLFSRLHCPSQQQLTGPSPPRPFLPLLLSQPYWAVHASLGPSAPGSLGLTGRPSGLFQVFPPARSKTAPCLPEKVTFRACRTESPRT